MSTANIRRLGKGCACTFDSIREDASRREPEAIAEEQQRNDLEEKMTSLKSDEAEVEAWFKDELECHFCRNVLSDPRSLNCSHHFCLECLEKLAYNLGNLHKGSGSEINLFCPSCKSGTVLEDSDGFSHLKTDLSTSHLMESLHGLGLISKDGRSKGSLKSCNVSGQSLELPICATLVDSVESVESVENPSFVTSVGSELSVASGSALLDDVTLAMLPQGNTKGQTASGISTSSRSFDESIRTLRSSGFKSPIAPSQVVPSDFDWDISLAISSEGNTATTKSPAPNNQTLHGKSSRKQRSENYSENGQANAMMERHPKRCPKHPRFQITLYCAACKVAICHRCKSEEHPGHEVKDLQAEAGLMRCEMVTMIKDVTAAIQTVGKAQNTLRSESESMLISQLDLVEKQVKANAQAMITQIEKDKERLLAEVSRVRQASSVQVLDALERDLKTGKRVATIVKQRGDAVDVVNTSRAICQKMRRATSICATGGAIDRVGELSVQFLGNGAVRDLAVGKLHENTRWTLSRQLSIPFDKRGCMQGMVSLRNGRLAVGYETGGIDIFSTQGSRDRPLSRILEGIKLVDLASTTDDTIIVYPMYGDVTEVTPEGEKRPTKFAAPTSKEHVSLSSSIDGRVFLGYAEHGEIHQFQQGGGNPLKSIPLGQCQPQQIDVTASGKVVVKDKSGVKVVDLTTDAITDIFKVGRGQFAYSTCDINDHVYIAKVSARDGKASIDKYRLDGSLLECVSTGLQMSKRHSGGHWLRLVSLSPSKLAACDGSLISIYQRQPSAIELANDLGL